MKDNNDIYGIDLRVNMAINNLFDVIGNTGKTEYLKSKLNNGDTVIVENKIKKIFLKKQFNNIDVIAIAPIIENLKLIRDEVVGNVYFDDKWIEMFYKCEINKIHKIISDFKISAALNNTKKYYLCWVNSNGRAIQYSAPCKGVIIDRVPSSKLIPNITIK